MPQVHTTASPHTDTRRHFFVFKDDLLSLLFMIVVYILYICCQVTLDLVKKWIQLWNKLLTNKKAAKTHFPVPRLYPTPQIHQKGSAPGWQVLGEKKCPSILSVAYISRHGTVFESLYMPEWRTESERFCKLIVGRSKTVHPRTNSCPLEKLVETAYLLTLCSIPKWHTGWTQDFCLVIVLNFIYGFLFLFLCFHIYSWRIFKLFFKNMLVNEFLRLTNSCFFGIF